MDLCEAKATCRQPAVCTEHLENILTWNFLEKRVDEGDNTCVEEEQLFKRSQNDEISNQKVDLKITDDDSYFASESELEFSGSVGDSQDWDKGGERLDPDRYYTLVYRSESSGSNPGSDPDVCSRGCLRLISTKKTTLSEESDFGSLCTLKETDILPVKDSLGNRESHSANSTSKPCEFSNGSECGNLKLTDPATENARVLSQAPSQDVDSSTPDVTKCSSKGVNTLESASICKTCKGVKQPDHSRYSRKIRIPKNAKHANSSKEDLLVKTLSKSLQSKIPQEGMEGFTNLAFSSSQDLEEQGLATCSSNADDISKTSGKNNDSQSAGSTSSSEFFEEIWEEETTVEIINPAVHTQDAKDGKTKCGLVSVICKCFNGSERNDIGSEPCGAHRYEDDVTNESDVDSREGIIENGHDYSLEDDPLMDPRGDFCRRCKEKITSNENTAGVFTESDDDVVIVSALRTPICKARRGGLKDTLPDDLLSTVFTATINKLGIDPTVIQDICVGNCLQPGAGANIARIAQFFSNIPETVTIHSVNRQCSSGLQACANIAASIKAGYIDVGIGAGVESMTINSMKKPRPGEVVNPNLASNKMASDTMIPMGIESMTINPINNLAPGMVLNPRLMQHDQARKALIAMGVESMTLNSMKGTPPGMAINERVMDVDKARDTLIPMGITSENVAERYGITRQMQDEMAVDSHKKAAEAQAKGYFKDEIVPVHTKLVDKDGNETPVVISKDDGVREGTSMETLAKLRPAFMEGGSTTAGNSSQVSDGAAAVVLARRSAAKRLGLPVLGVFRSFAVVGVPPDVMGIGPAYAIPKALEKAGLKIDDIEIYEINEAFASQARYSVEKLGIPMDKVNPKGGAIALGHPLGCTGARQVGTLLHELKRRGKRGHGVVSMCIGTGMGAAAVIEYPGN